MRPCANGWGDIWPTARPRWWCGIWRGATGYPFVMTAAVGAILLFLPSSVRPQIADVVRTWTPGDHLDGLWWAAGLIVVFSACVWCAGVVAAEVARGARPCGIVDKKYIVRNAVGIVAVAGATLILKHAGVDVGFPLGFVVAAAWAFNLGGVTAIAAGSAPVRPAEDVDSRRALACIAALPALFVSALVLRSAELVQRNQATAIRAPCRGRSASRCSACW